MNFKRLLILLLSLPILLAGCQTMGTSGEPQVSRAQQIDRDAYHTLNKLYGQNPKARSLASRAQGILVFPDIVKGGFMFGAQYGTGALLKGGRTAGYYNSISASYGLQAGVQTFGYVLFFMTHSALDYLNRSGGWEIGMGPSIVVVDAGVGKTLTTTTGKADVFAFIFDQKGLMAGLGLQGTKITKINP